MSYKSWTCVIKSLNNLIHRAFLSTDVLATREPTGLCTSAGVTGKRPDGVTTVPWKKGRCLAWDAICPDTFAFSNIQASSISAGSAAKIAEEKKIRFRFTSGNRLRPNSARNVRCMGRERIRTGARTWPKDYRWKLWRSIGNISAPAHLSGSSERECFLDFGDFEEQHSRVEE